MFTNKLPEITLHWTNIGMGNSMRHDLETNNVPTCPLCNKRLNLYQIELQVYGHSIPGQNPHIYATLLHYECEDHPNRKQTIEFI